MSEIDKMLISVTIDEGSNLEELYNMLKDIQKTGKIDVEFPDLGGVRRKIGQLDVSISNLRDDIKLLSEKFPEIEGSIKQMFDEIIIIKINEILDIVKKSLAEGFGEDIKSLLKDIQKQVSREQVLEVLDIVKKITNQLKTLQARLALQMRREFAKFDISKIDDIIRFVIDFSINLQNYLDQKIEDVWDIASIGHEQAIAITDFITIISKDLEDFKQNLPDCDEIKERLNRLHLDLNNAIRIMSDQKINFDNTSAQFREQIEEKLNSIDLNWYDIKDDVHKINDRLIKAIELREQARDKVAEEVGIQLDKFKGRLDDNLKGIIEPELDKFKGRLDDNLKGIIEPELDMFLDSVTAIFPTPIEKTLGSVWRAPGVKEVGETGYGEKLSGFFRNLVSYMVTMKQESLTGSIPHMITKGAVGRTLESIKSAGELSEIGEFFGIQLESEKETKELLKQIIDHIIKNKIKAEDIMGTIGSDVKSINRKLVSKSLEENNINKDEKMKG